MKITVYTIKDCAFSKQEKEYLNTNKLVFEEKDLETNKDFLTEMLAISNNFAGTPVTRVEKDDGTIAVLKGFTKEEFDTTFGFASAPTTPVADASKNETPLVAPVVEPTVPTAEVPPTEVVPAPAPVSTEPTIDETIQGPLKSVMDELQSKSQQPVPPQMPVAEPAVTPPADAPSIPDFPAK